MSYIITKLQPIKSYPTYQFYAKADSKTENPDSVFKICILETLKWIRARLKDFSDLPSQIMVYEPEEYNAFSLNTLESFSYSNGLILDVVYIEKKGVWSFKISETDMGANIGSKNERLPVHGRTFDTEITFAKQNEYVEIGVRTIVSEPSDTTADCEVFRPTVVKALAENTNIRLIQGGFILDKKPLEVKTKADAERLFSLYEDTRLNFPLVIICDTETKEIKADFTDFKPDNSSLDLKGGFSFNSSSNITVDATSFNFAKKANVPFKADKTKKAKEKPIIQKHEIKKEKLPVFDYASLADKLVGFGIIVFVDETLIKHVENKLQASLDYGKIIIIRNKETIEESAYNSYSKDMKQFFRDLREEIIAIPKRKQYVFGDVLFHSDAKLKEYHTKRHETSSLEELCDIYRLELDELRSQVKELSQHHTDMQQISDVLRITQKKAASLQNELETKSAEYDKLREEFRQKQDAYQKNADLITFYKKQIETASAFPTHKDDICDWIEEQYSDNIILTSRAKSEMKKYSGALDIASLCDGVVFINAYAQYRKHILDDEKLRLYAERNNWEVQSCGKEALRVRKSDYTVTYNDTQYIIDLHIKLGVKSEELIRIYFCWDDALNKIIIGSMPEHLATVKQNT